MKKTIAFFAVLLNLNAYACINFYGTSIFGEKVTIEGYELLFNKMHNRLQDSTTFLESKIEQLESRYGINGNSYNKEYLNDLAAIKIYQGKYFEAISILKNILISYPNEYQVHANLGVAYELIGKVDSAYYFTEKSIKINPNSHEKTEWLHLLILKASDLIKKDPNYFYSHYINGENISFNTLPERNILKLKIDSMHNVPMFIAEGYAKGEIVKAFDHQLQERLIFVKPHNTIVANLLFTLADFYTADLDYISAKQIYQLAEIYDPKLSNLCSLRIGGIFKTKEGDQLNSNSILKTLPKKEHNPIIFYSILSITCISVLLFFSLKKDK